MSLWNQKKTPRDPNADNSPKENEASESAELKKEQSAQISSEQNGDPAKSSPSVDQLTKELKREKHKRRYVVVLRSTVYALITVAAIAVLVATLWLPVLQIYGTSMTPTLSDGEIVVSFKGSKFEQGDLIAFYCGNKLLVKRVIAGPSDWVNIDEDGNVYVNGRMLDEPYLTEKAVGDCNIELPYQVPESSYFVMGDHRKNSSDSRNTAVGPVNEELIVGRIVFRVWPFDRFGEIKTDTVAVDKDNSGEKSNG